MHEVGFESPCTTISLPVRDPGRRRVQCVKLFVLPPSSPKLHGHVERARRPHAEEFYGLYRGTWRPPPFNQSLLEGENAYNTVRPQRSLEGLTPAKYLHQRHPDLVPVQPSHM